MRFPTILASDGSANDPGKRPVYRWSGATGRITRFADGRGLVAALCAGRFAEPVLLAADVPFGFPAAFAEVYQEHGGFLQWLHARGESDADWARLVVKSVYEQSPTSPFVTCRAGERKAAGRFPLRRCDALTGAESVFWCVGGKQVGKAALQFWRETLLPLRKHFGQRLAVWPFEDAANAAVVVAECYPAMLYERVWGRSVTKSDPVAVVDAVAARRQAQPSLCSDKTWLHAVSSDDEFDAFTAALALSEAPGDLLALPPGSASAEGWMLLLEDRAP